MAEPLSSSIRIGARAKLSVKVIAELRRRVLSGDLGPGERLPTEGQLTAAFGVSRTVVREAIAALAADGLVQPRQGAGVFVTNPASYPLGVLAADMGSRVATALNVLEIRLAIEVEGSGLAAIRRSPAQEAAIQEAFFDFERLVRLDAPTGSADLAFHRAIAVATGNPYYVEMLDLLGRRAIPCDVSLPDSTELVQTPDYQRQLQGEHHAILVAISGGDVEAARSAMRKHVANSQARYRARLSERQAHYARAADE